MPDAGVQPGANPVDHGVWGGVAVCELVEPGEACLGQPEASLHRVRALVFQGNPGWKIFGQAVWRVDG